MNSINRGWQAGPGTPASMPATGPDVGLEHVSPQTAEKIRRQRQAEGLRSRAEEVASQHPAPQPAPTPTPATPSRETAPSKVSAAPSTAGASTSKEVKVTPGPDEVVIPKSDYAVLMRAADAQLKAEETRQAAARQRAEDLRSGRQSFSLDRSRISRPAPRPASTRTTGRNRR